MIFFLCFSRFNCVKFHDFQPIFSISNANQIKFHIPGSTGSNIHLIQNLVLSIEVRLVNKNGGPVSNDLMIAPVNNIMGSLFSNTKIMIGNSCITQNTESIYPDYIKKLLSYGVDAQHSHMQSYGWYPDTGLEFDPNPTMTSNVGFIYRRNLFRKEDENPPHDMIYHNEWVTLAGGLHHDLKSCEVGIPPGIDIDVELEYSTNNFRLLCDEDADAILEIGKAELHIPVGEMNQTLFRGLHDTWQKKKMRLFHTRTIVTKHNIPTGSRVYFSNNIFSGGDTKPCRVFFFFLTNDQLYPANFKSNPYKLVRKFLHPITGKWIYVESFEMKVGGNSMDSLAAKGTLNEDTHSFLRFNQVNNTDTSPRSNGISYEDWLENTCLYGFDLSSSGKCSNEFWIPTLLAGEVTIKITFSGELPTGITLACFQEIPSLSTIDNKGFVCHSFFTGTGSR